jgi:flagellar protein FliO/FliZ
MKLHTFTRGAAICCALLLLHAPAALAGGGYNAFEKTRLSLNAQAHHTTMGSGSSGSIIRTIVALAIVIAVIYGLAWFVRHAKAAKNPAVGYGLEQLASLPLGTGRSVALVRVGSELHLLGVADHGVTTIRTFTEDEAVEFGLPVGGPGGDAEDRPAGAGLTRALESLRRMTIR